MEDIDKIAERIANASIIGEEIKRLIDEMDKLNAEIRKKMADKMKILMKLNELEGRLR